MPNKAKERMSRLIESLDSLVDGELAAAKLVACGLDAIPYLEHYLMEGTPRTVAVPRCRAVRALGELGAYPALIRYFKEFRRPSDAAVLFAEDAVLSAAARELARLKSEEIFAVLLEAARQRVTVGLVLALGEFQRRESIPLLFAVLEDDLCRASAIETLRKLGEHARQYAILSLRGQTETEMHGPSAVRRRWATLELLEDLGVAATEWPELKDFLFEENAGVVIAAAEIGMKAAPGSDRPRIFDALFRISAKVNWVQEDQIEHLLESDPVLAHEIARAIVERRRVLGEWPHWLVPSWRVLRHVLGESLEGEPYGVA